MYREGSNFTFRPEPISTGSLDSVSELLFQFQEINLSWLHQKQNDIIAKIEEHLKAFGENIEEGKIEGEKRNTKKKVKNSYCSEIIKGVCKNVIPNLNRKRIPLQLPDRPYIRPPKKTMLIRASTFQKKWLKNVYRLLPECKDVISVLPYLLTCYSINAGRNKIDPFSHRGKGTIPVADSWTDIFPDRLSGEAKQRIKQQQKEGRNRTRNRIAAIQSLSRHFVYLPYPQDNAFLYQHGAQLYTGLSRVRSVETMEKIRADSARKKYIQCWEQYRWFACFCEACKNIKDVNITLSMALFTTLWDKTSICYPLCKNRKCIEASGNPIPCYDDLPWNDLKEFQVSQSDVENDAWRNNILDELAINQINSICSHLRV